jgi:hypothetical protein
MCSCSKQLHLCFLTNVSAVSNDQEFKKHRMFLVGHQELIDPSSQSCLRFSTDANLTTTIVKRHAHSVLHNLMSLSP